MGNGVLHATVPLALKTRVIEHVSNEEIVLFLTEEEEIGTVDAG